MKNITLYSWNVNGIRAVAKKGFFDFIKNTNPDILAIQETKASENQLAFDLKMINDYQSHFSSSNTKKGYSGVATYSKSKPLNVAYGMGALEFDNEGRILITEYEKFTLLNVYFPNGKASAQRLDYKMRFYDAFLEYILKLTSKGKSIVFCGDVNTAHKPIDLARPKDNETVSGFLPSEREWIDKVVSHGFIDTYRLLNKDKVEYSWWSQRSGARARNVGWRIDYFFISPDLKDTVVQAEIHSSVLGSDHCPISLTLNL